jgi:ZIP family zinc transporter
MTPLMMGALGSLAAGMMTTVGALPILAGRGVSQRVNDMLLGFAAGVMLAASFFSLIIPGLAAAELTYGPGWRPAALAVAGVLAGALSIRAMDKAIPHRHFISGQEGPNAEKLKKIWLFIIAITIHNLPEGLAVGIGFGGGDVATGLPLAIGIGLQNAPEGLAVALALRSEGYSRYFAFLVAALTGMVEPVSGIAGAAAIGYSVQLLPWGLVFAAGAMIYVISHEIIPETHRAGNDEVATSGLMVGLVLMLFLDVWLG